MSFKYCTKCKESKETKFFPKIKTTKSGFHSNCKHCLNKMIRERYKQQSNKDIHRNRILKYKFGITLNDYRNMVKDQSGKCATCKRHQSELSKILVVDHCHKTGNVRGLLCDYCNRLIGNYEAKPELFNNFDIYLNKQENINGRL